MRLVVRRLARVLVVIGLAGLMFPLAVPANALITQAGCQGNITYTDTGQVVDASAPLEPLIEVPSKGRVEYFGQLDQPQPVGEEVEMTYRGGVSVLFATGSWTAAAWGTATTKDSVAGGFYEYKVPDWAPKGTGAIPVEITHNHGDLRCKATLNVALAGSPWGPMSIGVLIGAVVFMLAMLGAGFFRTDKGRGRPILGLIAGFFFGLLTGASLFLFGILDLENTMLFILPLLFTFIGLVLALWAPFGGSTPPPPTATTTSDVHVSEEVHHTDHTPESDAAGGGGSTDE